MAMNCCHKEYVEVCEILVCVDAPAPHSPSLYQRLRFGLLSSSWLPRPLGIFVWSTLHVMFLIVGGPVYWVLGLLAVFLFYSVCLFALSEIYVCFIHVLIVVPLILVILLVEAIMFCWSLVACHEPFVEWRWGDCSPVLLWKDFKELVTMYWRSTVPFGVPCMSGSLYKRSKDRQLKTGGVKRWCTCTTSLPFNASLKSMPMRKICQNL